MLKRDKNMGNYLIDLKVCIGMLSFYIVSFSNVDIFMKVFSFFLVCAFTMRRWYLMEKRKKDEND